MYYRWSWILMETERFWVEACKVEWEKSLFSRISSVLKGLRFVKSSKPRKEPEHLRISHGFQIFYKELGKGCLGTSSSKQLHELRDLNLERYPNHTPRAVEAEFVTSMTKQLLLWGIISFYHSLVYRIGGMQPPLKTQLLKYAISLTETWEIIHNKQ